MKIKVCGMKFPENIEGLLEYAPDYIGHIFYEKSPRYVGDNLLHIPSNEEIKRVGVFVNSPLEIVIATAKEHNLDILQLHGDESLDYIKTLHDTKFEIIKAFQITPDFTWQSIEKYSSNVRYFLFDTATKNYGGSGKKFDWTHLKKYKGDTPFFLSGGISIEDVQTIKNLALPMLCGIDINSRFETAPGMKNLELVKTMINLIRNE